MLYFVLALTLLASLSLSGLLMVTTAQLQQATADLNTVTSAYQATLAENAELKTHPVLSPEDEQAIEGLVTNLRTAAAPFDAPAG